MYYCIGDIHGRLDLLRSARYVIKQDANKNEYTDSTIVYLGDYVDRGPESAQVLEELISNPLKDFKEIHIRGNHEDIMLAGLGAVWHPSTEKASWRRMWLENGGITAVKSYGNNPLIKSENFDHELDSDSWNWRTIINSIPQRHIDFMLGLPYYHDNGEYFFVHGGVRLDAPVDDPNRQGGHVYSWARPVNEYTGEYVALDGKKRIIVHGHTPTKGGLAYESKNRYNLDNNSVWCNKQAIGVFGEESGPRIIYTPFSPRPEINTSGIPT